MSKAETRRELYIHTKPRWQLTGVLLQNLTVNSLPNSRHPLFHPTTGKIPNSNSERIALIQLLWTGPLWRPASFQKQRDVGRIGCFRCWLTGSPSLPRKLVAGTGHPIELLFVQEETHIMSDHSFRLLQYHQRLDGELREELRRNWPSFARIQRLKKLKLAVKDRLNRLVIRSKKASETA
jgi:uncharacterized protein